VLAWIWRRASRAARRRLPSSGWRRAPAESEESEAHAANAYAPWRRATRRGRHGGAASRYVRALTAARDIHISEAALADLSGLHSLTSVVHLRLGQASQLHDLRGLASLREVSILSLHENPALTSLDGLEKVTEIGWLDLSYNFALSSVAGLRNVTHIQSSLYLDYNPALTALAFTNLRSINGPLWIRSLSVLRSLSGLDALSSVTGPIDFYDNTNLPQAEIQAFLARLGH